MSRSSSNPTSDEAAGAVARRVGPENAGLATGDATVNRDARVLCCTAEILANIALREGSDAAIDDVVMNEFHWYADRDRGVAWQVPLLTLPRTRFLLPASSTCTPSPRTGGVGWRGGCSRR